MGSLYPLDNWIDWNADLLAPGSHEFDVVGAALESPRALSGRRRMADLSGGGFVTYTMDGVPVDTPAAMRAWNRISKVLSMGGIVVVPILASFIAPLPIGVLAGDGLLHDQVDGTAFSDGSLFSDGSGFVPGSVDARLCGDHAMGAGTITFDLSGAQPIEGGEIISVFSVDQGFRAHRIDPPDHAHVMGTKTRYVCAIQPPLRDVIPDGTIVDFRPRCLMELAPGENMPMTPGTSDWWTFKGSVKLVEAT